MIIGELRYKIKIKKLVQTQDPLNGSVVPTWETKYTLKAKKTQRSGAKTINNNEVFNTSTIVFTCYYRNIVDTDIVEFEGQDYKIMHIAEISEVRFREGLELTVDKINA